MEWLVRVLITVKDHSFSLSEKKNCCLIDASDDSKIERRLISQQSIILNEQWNRLYCDEGYE